MKAIRSMPESSGENLTLSGLEWELIRPGVRLTIGPDDPARSHELYNAL